MLTASRLGRCSQRQGPWSAGAGRATSPHWLTAFSVQRYKQEQEGRQPMSALCPVFNVCGFCILYMLIIIQIMFIYYILFLYIFNHKRVAWLNQTICQVLPNSSWWECRLGEINLSFFFNVCLFYLKGRVTGRAREIFPCTGSLLKHQEQLELGQTEAGSPRSH